MTHKEIFAHIMSVMAEDAEVVEFCEKQLKRLSAPKTRKVDPEVAERRATVMAFMADVAEGPMLSKDIAAQLGGEMTKGQVNAALRALVADGAIQKIAVGSANLYAMPNAE